MGKGGYKGDYKAALADIQKAQDLDSRSGRMCLEKAWTYALMGDMKSALTQLRTAEEIDPGHLHVALFTKAWGGGIGPLLRLGSGKAWPHSVAAYYLGKIPEAQLLEEARKKRKPAPGDSTVSRRIATGWNRSPGIGAKSES